MPPEDPTASIVIVSVAAFALRVILLPAANVIVSVTVSAIIGSWPEMANVENVLDVPPAPPPPPTLGYVGRLSE